MTLTMYKFPEIIILLKCYNLTEVAGEGGPDLTPQKFLQQFRHLMRCRKYVNKACLPCLVPDPDI